VPQGTPLEIRRIGESTPTGPNKASSVVSVRLQIAYSKSSTTSDIRLLLSWVAFSAVVYATRGGFGVDAGLKCGRL
jgi:hypothetical protein